MQLYLELNFYLNLHKFFLIQELHKWTYMLFIVLKILPTFSLFVVLSFC